MPDQILRRSGRKPAQRHRHPSNPAPTTVVDPEQVPKEQEDAQEPLPHQTELMERQRRSFVGMLDHFNAVNQTPTAPLDGTIAMVPDAPPDNELLASNTTAAGDLNNDQLPEPATIQDTQLALQDQAADWLSIALRDICKNVSLLFTGLVRLASEGGWYIVFGKIFAWVQEQIANRLHELGAGNVYFEVLHVIFGITQALLSLDIIVAICYSRPPQVFCDFLKWLFRRRR